MKKSADSPSTAKKVAEDSKPQLALPAPKPKQFDFKTDKKSSFWKTEMSLGKFIIAMIVIVLLGLAVGGGIYYLTNPNLWRAPQIYPQPVTNNVLSLYLDIDNPEDESLVFDSAVIVSGKTSPNASIVISTSDNQAATMANPFGEFSKVFSLIPGINLIQISAYDEVGNSKTELRRVYFSEEKLQQ